MKGGNTRQLVFIDDSGDPGFKGAGASANFVLAAAVFNNETVVTELNKVFANYKKELGWDDATEFKFSKTRKSIIKELLRRSVRYDYEVYAMYLEKKQAIGQSINTKNLYERSIGELLSNIPMSKAKVVIDGRSGKRNMKRVAAYLRHETKDARQIAKIKFEDSTNDNMIQLADLLAGSVNRSLQPSKTDHADYERIFRNKIKLKTKFKF